MTNDLDSQLKELIMSFDLGYIYQMSDYATSIQQEKKFEAKGLAEVDEVVKKIKALIAAREAELLDQVKENIEAMKDKTDGLEQYVDGCIEYRNALDDVLKLLTEEEK